MSRDELSTPLNEPVEDVDRPDLAARAWMRGRRIRRRTAVVVAPAVLLVLLVLLVVARAT